MEEKSINKIIEVAYGGGNFFDKKYVRKLISENEEAKQIFDEYAETASEVKSIQKENCPPELIEIIKQKTKVEQSNRFFMDLYEMLFAKPAFSVAVMAISSAIIITAIFTEQTRNEVTFTQQEVEIADKQVKEALVLVSSLFKKSQTTIKEDILTEKVSKPLNKGINIVNNLLEEGGEK